MKFSPLMIRIIAFAIAPIACLAGVYARVRYEFATDRCDEELISTHRTSKMKFT
jgi:hypothetical protein